MKDLTLVIMAAGIGSRYGKGIKQLEHVGPSGEIIMDYSIFDAKEAGFNKVVFIIRKEIEEEFREIIGNRIEKEIKVDYAFQELDNLPSGFKNNMNRTKPYGTGHALLCCKGIVNEPFVVINADDYYGKEGFVKIYNYLNQVEKNSEHDYCMAGFILGNTLSDNGTVTRGICKVDSNNYLSYVSETFELRKVGELVNGIDSGKNAVSVPASTPVSMNMWGFTPDFFDELEVGFTKFLKELSEDDIKSEYLLPSVVGEMVEKQKAKVAVLPTSDKWFGVTYIEDKEKVVNSINKLVDEGVYPKKLFNRI